MRAMAVRQRKAGGGSGGAGGGEGRALAVLEGVLREVYDAAKGLRQGQLERRVELPELGDLFVKVYAVRYEQEWGVAVFMVFKRNYKDPLCEVELYLNNGEPSAVYVSSGMLEFFASRCARGEDCALSWEEARTALELTVWAANRLAELAGIPAKVEGAGLVEAYSIWNGKPHVFPCLQVSVDGKSYLVCGQVHLLCRDTDRGWEVKGYPRLVSIGEVYAKMVRVLAELWKMVEEYVKNRKRKGAKSTRTREHRGEFLELEEVVLRRRDGTEEVLLKPQLYSLDYIREGFAVVKCSYSYMESSDSELAAMIKKEVEEAWREVVQAVRRYMETGDPRLTTFAYIAAEAVRRAGLAPA